MNKQTILKSIGKAMAAVMAAVILFTALPAAVYAETTGKVSVDTAKVRSDASTDSDTVKQITSGTTVTVIDKKADSSGTIWYQVSLSDGTTGYIRSDLLEVTETADAPADTAEETTEAAPAADTSSNVVDGVDVSAIVVPDAVDHTDLQKASIIVSAGKIRSNASTNDSIVATLSEGEKLIIAGSKLGSDSKTWYFVAFSDGGTQKTGYIRSDLISLGETIQSAAPVEETPAEDNPTESEPSNEVTESNINNDYELVYTDDGTGSKVWYLYNHIDNTREKLQELLDFADYQQKQQGIKDAQIKKLRVFLIVLAALLLLAIVAIAFLIIKLRMDGYGYDYDDDDDVEIRASRRDDRTSSRRSRYNDDEDDEEEEEEEEIPVRSRRRTQEESPAPQRRRRTEDEETDLRRERSNTPRKPVSYEEDDDMRVAPQRKNKSKNFIIDDDFEFEFLNMDDK